MMRHILFLNPQRAIVGIVVATADGIAANKLKPETYWTRAVLATTGGLFLIAECPEGTASMGDLSKTLNAARAWTYGAAPLSL